uniref:RING-type domain-containing protein n=1 Tax=Zooxanthella nutricula TaxID=1333877 RepID=A0A6U6QYV6_9DINO|mmetsp:Transcript_68888/g.211290  ORF Transcript_68888/g.211290 Transcript_68888/m.211290 type:complete len:489 (+) Transcript_68888:110-1576(+)
MGNNQTVAFCQTPPVSEPKQIEGVGRPSPAPASDPSIRLASSQVAFVILPGSEDPAALMRRGGLEVKWTRGGAAQTVPGHKLQEACVPRAVDVNLLLPTLYLHFLADDFLMQDRDIDLALKSGNDNSELIIALPGSYDVERVGDSFGCLAQHLARVLTFLRAEGEIPVGGCSMKAGGFGPHSKYSCRVDDSRVYFSLKTARPKSDITLDKASFGIPEAADLYLFVHNHCSVEHMDEDERSSFEACIEQLPDEGGSLANLACFLKVFYEGGFAYNERRVTGTKTYLPVNLGIACMSVVPAFEGQTGISTGYPFLVPSGFVPFADTVPVTIRAIHQMSSRHHRYGLCFTRCVMVWASDDFEQDGVLHYSIVAPHGGFFYAPAGLKDHRRLGGLVYAFGEARSALEAPEDLATAASGGAAPTCGDIAPGGGAGRANEDRRVCTVCLDAEATMAAVPCGHRAYCGACAGASAPTSRPCPVCRAAVADVLRVY